MDDEHSEFLEQLKMEMLEEQQREEMELEALQEEQEQVRPTGTDQSVYSLILYTELLPEEQVRSHNPRVKPNSRPWKPTISECLLKA